MKRICSMCAFQKLTHQSHKHRCNKVKGTGKRCRRCRTPIWWTPTKPRTFCSMTCAKMYFTKHRHPAWKGGSCINKSGYKIIYIGVNKHQQEHRYIMEQRLGRVLHKFEHVHHKNGIRTDNRLQNLELWASHPPGQRVTDLLRFCITYYRKDLLRLL